MLVHHRASRCGALIISAVVVLLPVAVRGASTRSEVAPSVGLTLSDVCDGVRGRAQRLSTRSVSFRETLHSAMDASLPPILEREFRFWRSPDGFRFDRSKGVAFDQENGTRLATKDVIEREAWDGRELTVLREVPTAPPEHRYMGSIAGRRLNAPTTYFWRAFVEDCIGASDESLSAVLRDGGWRLLGKRKIGQYAAVGIANTSPLADLPGLDLEVWVAPENDFAPISMKCTRKDGDALRFSFQMENVELELRAGIWVIASAHCWGRVFPQDPKLADTVFTYQLLDFSPQVPADISDYSLSFPVGTVTYDETSRQSFIAGKLGVVQDIDGLHYYVPLSLFPDYIKRTDYSRGLSDEEWEQMMVAKDIASNYVENPSSLTGIDHASGVHASPVDGRVQQDNRRVWLFIWIALGGCAGTMALIYWRHANRRG